MKSDFLSVSDGTAPLARRWSVVVARQRRHTPASIVFYVINCGVERPEEWAAFLNEPQGVKLCIGCGLLLL